MVFKSEVLAAPTSPFLISLQPKVTQFICFNNNKSNNLFLQHNVQWVRQSYTFPPASNWRTHVLQVSLTHTHTQSRQTYLWRLHATCPNVSTAPKKSLKLFIKSFFVLELKKKRGSQKRGRKRGWEGGRSEERKAASFSSISPSPLLFISLFSSLVQHADGG